MAKFLNGSYAEKDIDLRIVVLDDNDCAPVFTTQMSGAVHELTARGTGNIHRKACWDAKDKCDKPHYCIKQFVRYNEDTVNVLDNRVMYSVAWYSGKPFE